MAKSTNGKSGATKPDTTPRQEHIFAHQAYDILRDVEKKYNMTFWTPEGWKRIFEGVTSQRCPYGFSKSDNGTKGTDEPKKLVTLSVNELDPTQAVVNLSPVCADKDRIRLWSTIFHAFNCLASWEFDPENHNTKRLYKQAFREHAEGAGLIPTVKKIDDDGTEERWGASAYTHYFDLSAPTKTLLKDVSPPPLPFVIEGTEAGPMKRHFTVSAFNPAIHDGRKKPVSVSIKNPEHSKENDASCEEHAKKYDWLVFFDSAREDWSKALAFYTTEGKQLAAAMAAAKAASGEDGPETEEQEETTEAVAS
jgi:hypothetical protein